jgi:hypothetical protein
VSGTLDGRRRNASNAVQSFTFAAYKRALKCLACLQYLGMFRIAVLDPGSMQFRKVKKGIDVKPLGVSAHMQHSVCESWGSPMRVERNVMGGLLAIIAIGFVAIVVGGFLS